MFLEPSFLFQHTQLKKTIEHLKIFLSLQQKKLPQLRDRKSRPHCTVSAPSSVPADCMRSAAFCWTLWGKWVCRVTLQPKKKRKEKKWSSQQSRMYPAQEMRFASGRVDVVYIDFGITTISNLDILFASQFTHQQPMRQHRPSGKPLKFCLFVCCLLIIFYLLFFFSKGKDYV